MSHGWWRRNVWGLILVVPLTAGLFAINAEIIYDANYGFTPQRPAPIDATGTAVLDDYRAKLTSIDPVGRRDDELADRGITLPDSVQVWRAVVTFTGSPESSIGTCNEIALIDEDERAYSSAPDALDYLGAYTCGPDDYEASSPYTTTYYFLLPAQSRPQALRIVWRPLLPRYVRLPVAA